MSTNRQRSVAVQVGGAVSGKNSRRTSALCLLDAGLMDCELCLNVSIFFNVPYLQLAHVNLHSSPHQIHVTFALVRSR